VNDVLSPEEIFEFGAVVALVNDEVSDDEIIPIPSFVSNGYILTVSRMQVSCPETFDHELIIHINEVVGGNYVDEYIRRANGDWATESGAEIDGEILGYRRLMTSDELAGYGDSQVKP
jgi:hypothetical protein